MFSSLLIKNLKESHLIKFGEFRSETKLILSGWLSKLEQALFIFFSVTFLDKQLKEGMMANRNEDWQPLLVYRNSLIQGDAEERSSVATGRVNPTGRPRGGHRGKKRAVPDGKNMHDEYLPQSDICVTHQKFLENHFQTFVLKTFKHFCACFDTAKHETFAHIKYFTFFTVTQNPVY